MATTQHKIFSAVFGPAKPNGFWRILYYEDLHGLDTDTDPVTCKSIERLQWPGYVVRTFENRNPKEYWKKISEEDSPPGSPGIDGKINCGRIRPHFSTPKVSMHRKGTGVI